MATYYYQVQRGIASTENGRLQSVTNTNGDSKQIAVIPFLLPKLGGINAWEFSAVDSSDKGFTPTGFRAFLFSCAQAFLDYVKQEYGETITSPVLEQPYRHEVKKYAPPPSYTGNPGDYIIIGGSSIRDSETYPNHNNITISYSHGDRPYYNDDAERFWALDDRAYYFAVVELDPSQNTKKLVSTLYYV